MSDRLREALERYDAVLPASTRPDALNTVLAAARRFLALTETGQQVEWCEVHRHEGFDSEHEPGWVCESGVWLEDEGHWDCRMTPVYLVPADYLTEDSTP